MFVLTIGKILNLHVNVVNKLSDDCQCTNQLGDTTYKLKINNVIGTVNYVTGSDNRYAIVLTILNGNYTSASVKNSSNKFPLAQPNFVLKLSKSA